MAVWLPVPPALSLQTGPEDERLEAIYERLDEIDPNTFEVRAAELLHGLGFSKTMMNRMTKDMSGGWRMRCVGLSGRRLAHEVGRDAVQGGSRFRA